MKRIRTCAPVGPPWFGPEDFGFYNPEIPLTLPGTGGSRVQGHKLLFRSMRMHGSHGTDAAASVVKGMTDAGKAKGVFYDN